MMPRPKIVTSRSRLALSMATGFEHVADAALLLRERIYLGLIENRHLNLEADAIDRQHEQRQTDLGAQLGDLPDDFDFFPHGFQPL